MNSSSFELGPKQTLWLEALESGAFKQGVNFLCKNNKYCCLGVACELFAPEIKQKPDARGIVYFNGNPSCLPGKVQDALKLHGKFGEHSDPELLSTFDLANLNDKDVSFSEIAAIIRADPSAYFFAPA